MKHTVSMIRAIKLCLQEVQLFKLLNNYVTFFLFCFQNYHCKTLNNTSWNPFELYNIIWVSTEESFFHIMTLSFNTLSPHSHTFLYALRAVQPTQQNFLSSSFPILSDSPHKPVFLKIVMFRYEMFICISLANLLLNCNTHMHVPPLTWFISIWHVIILSDYQSATKQILWITKIISTLSTDMTIITILCIGKPIIF